MEGSYFRVLFSLEPTLPVKIEEGEPFGAEGSLETLAGTLSISSQFGSKQAGSHIEVIPVLHRMLDADVRVYLVVLNFFTEDTAIVMTLNEVLSEGVVDGEASILGDELELLQPEVTGPRLDLLRIFAFASHLLFFVVHNFVEAFVDVDSLYTECLPIATGFARLVNHAGVHSEPFVTFCLVE